MTTKQSPARNNGPKRLHVDNDVREETGSQSSQHELNKSKATATRSNSRASLKGTILLKNRTSQLQRALLGKHTPVKAEGLMQPAVNAYQNSRLMISDVTVKSKIGKTMSKTRASFDSNNNQV